MAQCCGQCVFSGDNQWYNLLFHLIFSRLGHLLSTSIHWKRLYVMGSLWTQAMNANRSLEDFLWLPTTGSAIKASTRDKICLAPFTKVSFLTEQVSCVFLGNFLWLLAFSKWLQAVMKVMTPSYSFKGKHDYSLQRSKLTSDKGQNWTQGKNTNQLHLPLNWRGRGWWVGGIKLHLAGFWRKSNFWIFFS